MVNKAKKFTIYSQIPIPLTLNGIGLIYNFVLSLQQSLQYSIKLKKNANTAASGIIIANKATLANQKTKEI